jgi:hypothetical protein
VITVKIFGVISAPKRLSEAVENIAKPGTHGRYRDVGGERRQVLIRACDPTHRDRDQSDREREQAIVALTDREDGSRLDFENNPRDRDPESHSGDHLEQKFQRAHISSESVASSAITMGSASPSQMP